MIISTKERKEKVKNSHYWGIDTKLMVEKKSQDTHISQNKLIEMCIQRHLPSMTF